MKPKLYDITENEKLLEVPDIFYEPIVEGILNRGNYVMLIAEEKVGKTIFAQQLVCSMSAGTPFLNILDVPKPVKVWYFATEGRKEDLIDRFIRMNSKVKMNPENIKLISSHFRFNTKEGIESLTEIVDTYEGNYPDVIVIDALYRAIKGSLISDDVVNEFHYVVGKLAADLNCAVILVHHMKKPIKDDKGKDIKRSDKDSYGSAFLAAAVDHIFWLEKFRDKDHPKDRMLKCHTQRSGDMIDNIRLRLNEPDPLYFSPVTKFYNEKKQIKNVLHGKADGYHVDEISRRADVCRTNSFAILKELQNEGLVEKYGTKKKYYKLIPYNTYGNG